MSMLAFRRNRPVRSNTLMSWLVTWARVGGGGQEAGVRVHGQAAGVMGSVFAEWREVCRHLVAVLGWIAVIPPGGSIERTWSMTAWTIRAGRLCGSRNRFMEA